MTLSITVAASDPTPVYEQLRRQMADAITAGLLAAETRLPTVRQLASDLGIAPGTVMRAYSELEAAGFVATNRGSGTVVRSIPTSTDAATGQLTRLASDFVQTARNAGASDPDILAAVGRALR